MAWRSPGLARWESDRWVIRSQWLDKAASANSRLDSLRHLQMSLCAWAHQNGIKRVSYEERQISYLHLPEGADSVTVSSPVEPSRINLGSNGYIQSSVTVTHEGDHFVVMDKSTAAFSTDTRFFISADRIAEQFISGDYTVQYRLDGRPTLSWLDSLDRARLDLKYHTDPIGEFRLWDGDAQG